MFFTVLFCFVFYFRPRFPPLPLYGVFQKLTLSLIKASVGAETAPTLEEVTAKFEQLYQGVDGQPGLKDVETLIPAKGGSSAAAAAAVSVRPSLDVLLALPALLRSNQKHSLEHKNKGRSLAHKYAQCSAFEPTVLSARALTCNMVLYK